MSAVTFFKVEKALLNLEDNIRKSKLICEPFAFQMIIKNSINILSSILQMIRNKNNLYGKNIATELLINIILFLSYEYFSACKSVCKTWKNSLNSCLSKKIFPSVPKNMVYRGSFNLGFSARKNMKIKDNIYARNGIKLCKINIKNFEKVEENNMNFYNKLEFSNDNYMLINGDKKLEVFSLDMKPISEIPKPYRCGITSDNNNNIYILSYNKFYIYSINGNLIKSWDFENNGPGPGKKWQLLEMKFL
jgi:hypothetical protein